MSRVAHWPERLDALVLSRLHLPFAWGTQDCCQFARRAVEAVTGRDPAADWGLVDYVDRAGGLRELERLGGAAALPVRAGFAGLPRVALAGRGDLILFLAEERESLGVCLGLRTVAPGARGLVAVPTLDCLKAWRIQ